MTYSYEDDMLYNDSNINKNQRLYFDDGYQSLPVMNGHYPMVEEYLQALHGVLTKALEQHRRVFAFRVDLRLPVAAGENAELYGNSVVSRFIESLKAKIRHNRAVASRTQSYTHQTKLRYFWVREVGDCGRVHYHAVFLLNGDAFNWLGNYQSSAVNMANRVCEAWASALGESVATAKALVHFPDHPTYTIQRDDPCSVEVFFHRASYLCKARTKQYGAGHHGYGASRS